MRTALRAIATMIDPTAGELSFPFHRLDHAHVSAIRSRLAEKHAPATANRMLAASRGVIKTSFKGGRVLHRRMTEQAVAELVMRLAKTANVATFSPHDLVVDDLGHARRRGRHRGRGGPGRSFEPGHHGQIRSTW